jgi:hypothetical protein
MFLFYFRSEKSLLEKVDPSIVVVKKNNYYTLMGSDKKKLILLKKKLVSYHTNPFENLIDDSIVVSPVNIKINNDIFEHAYNISKKNFIKEIIDNLYRGEYINFYNNNIIYLPKDVKSPYKMNYNTYKVYPIQFRKNIFLQNYDFICELNKELISHDKSIMFKKINKFIWKKIIVNFSHTLPDHNK